MKMKRNQAEFWAMPKHILAMHELPLEARMVYAILWTRSNGENVAWPGQKKIADELGIGERSVRRYLEKLRGAGLIEIERQGNNRTNRYLITGEPTGQIGRTGPATCDLSGPATVGRSSMKRTVLKEQREMQTAQAPTPSQIAARFFEAPTAENEVQKEMFEYFMSKGLSREHVWAEFKKFWAKWTEPSPGGTKQRWQMEKTFEVRRRLVTWFGYAEKYATVGASKPRHTVFHG